jgi:hypothetical protein
VGRITPPDKVAQRLKSKPANVRIQRQQLVESVAAVETKTKLLLRCLSVPNFDVIKQAALTRDAELDLGFGGMSDARGL